MWLNVIKSKIVLEGNSRQDIGFYKCSYTFILINPDYMQVSAFNLIKRNEA